MQKLILFSIYDRRPCSYFFGNRTQEALTQWKKGEVVLGQARWRRRRREGETCSYEAALEPRLAGDNSSSSSLWWLLLLLLCWDLVLGKRVRSRDQRRLQRRGKVTTRKNISLPFRQTSQQREVGMNETLSKFEIKIAGLVYRNRIELLFMEFSFSMLLW